MLYSYTYIVYSVNYYGGTIIIFLGILSMGMISVCMCQDVQAYKMKARTQGWIIFVCARTSALAFYYKISA